MPSKSLITLRQATTLVNVPTVSLSRLGGVAVTNVGVATVTLFVGNDSRGRGVKNPAKCMPYSFQNICTLSLVSHIVLATDSTYLNAHVY